MAQQHKQLDFCLLIPVYNNPEGLIEALESVHYPSGSFLVVIVDDGSSTPVTLESLSLKSQRLPLHIIRAPRNEGITGALNRGLEWICAHTTARYVARLDCNDRCTEDRFVEQVRFLDAHPDVGLLGSWCRFENGATRQAFTYKAPADDRLIRRAMHLRNVFIHPTVMLRSVLLRQGVLYPVNYPHAEDYAFFWSILKQSEGAIIQRPLVTAALNSAGISSANRQLQLQSCQKVIAAFGTEAYLKTLGSLVTRLRMWIPQGLILRFKTSSEGKQ